MVNWQMLNQLSAGMKASWGLWSPTLLTGAFYVFFYFYHSSFFPADLQTSTSFPGSLIFPRSLWGGEIKDSGNEVAVNIWHFSPSQLLQWSRLPSADAPTPYDAFTNVHFNVGNMSRVVLWLRHGFEKSVFLVPLFCFSRFFSVYGIRKPPK